MKMPLDINIFPPRSGPSIRKLRAGSVKHLLRKHKDGTAEVIICLTDGPVRFFAADEHTAYSRAANFLSGSY